MSARSDLYHRYIYNQNIRAQNHQNTYNDTELNAHHQNLIFLSSTQERFFIEHHRNIYLNKISLRHYKTIKINTNHSKSAQQSNNTTRVSIKQQKGLEHLIKQLNIVIQTCIIKIVS